jgi:von Willebrand factor type A domain
MKPWINLTSKLLLLLWSAMLARAGDHVRVIFDTSKSMRSNDAPRLAALSTALLYDLANLNISRGDSFEVLPFDSTWPFKLWTSGPPPVHTKPQLLAQHGGRLAFLEELRKTGYDAQNTYYFPPLKVAIDDLKKTPGGTSDRRVVVLITDGVPEDPDKHLITDLVSQAVSFNIRLYILALGPEAAAHSQELHEILGGPDKGALFVDPTGENLLGHMIEIFSRSFGFTAEKPKLLTSTLPLDLEGSQKPASVAVVSYWRNPKAPSLNLSPPVGHGLNNPEGLHTAEETRGSYAVRWIVTPGPGMFSLAADSPGASVAVLRPSRLSVEIRPQPGKSIQYTMAKVELPARVLVRPPGGAKGDPGPVDLSFQTHGPKTASGYMWDGKPEGPTSTGTVTPDGRHFDVLPIFPPDPVESHEYTGWLTTEVRRGEAVIGTEAARVLVYPFLRLSPSPPDVNAAIGGEVRALQHRETACATFAYQLDGALPHPDRPSYSLRATIDPAMSGDPHLNRARFTLDGVVLAFFGVPGPNPGEWYTGKTLSREVLLGPHQLCVQAGRPKDADPAKPVEIPIQLELTESPYDLLPVVLPVKLIAYFSPASFLEQNAVWISLALLLLALALLALAFRGKPDIPSGLEFASSREGSADRMSAFALAPRWPALHFLGLNRDHPVTAEHGTVTLGWVKPVTLELYRFSPTPGVTLLGDTKESTKQNGLLSVRRIYLAKASGANYQFRIQHR